MKVNDKAGNIVIPKKVEIPKPQPQVSGVGDVVGATGSKKPEFVHEKIMEAIRSEPEIRTELVEKYKALIKSGEYRMEPEELASRMVEDSFSESILRSKT